MTITDEGSSSALLAVEARPGDAPPQGGGRLGGRRLLVLLGLALLVVAIILGVGWWRSHPTAFGGAGDQFTARFEANTPVYVSMAGPFGPDHLSQVSLIEATAAAEIFGAAQVEVLQCSGMQIGIVSGAEIGDACFAVGTLEGPGPMMWDQVVIKVTPESPGTIVVVEGIDLTYSDGLQRGREFTGTPGVLVFPTDAG